jgi:hypothetical protein
MILPTEGSSVLRRLVAITRALLCSWERRERFVRKPPVPPRPRQAVWINKPIDPMEPVGCQKSVVAVTSRFCLTEGYDASSLARLP